MGLKLVAIRLKRCKICCDLGNVLDVETAENMQNAFVYMLSHYLHVSEYRH